MSLPYENSTSGKSAVDEMQKILRSFGASSFGCMEDFDKGEVIVQFMWRERRVTVTANAKGYAARWLKEHPWTFRMKGSAKEHEKKALKIGQIAVYSILRDWVKGQITAVEIGMLSFEGAFLGQIHLADGRTVLEAIETSETLRLPKSAT